MFTTASAVPPPPGTVSSSSSQPFPACLENGNGTKRKRRPAGTPDPDAEVVSLSPRTLLESDRYVCEICGQGFQRDQNLQMHRRRHKVPWKLLKREDGAAAAARKRVYVCPEPSCLHHDPAHALGDLVGIKKHFRRKHSAHRQWACARCSKAYAVQSDYKAHLKTCGTRGHSCDCGRVFSRVESFIEHQDTCNAGRARAEPPTLQPACLSMTASSPSPSSHTNISIATWPGLRMPASAFPNSDQTPSPADHHRRAQSMELQLLPASDAHCPTKATTHYPVSDEARDTELHLSVGPSSNAAAPAEPMSSAEEIKEGAREQLQLAMAEKAVADEARSQARRQIEFAEQEFANAKRIRQQAQVELNKALALREHAVKQINSRLLEITCHACKQQFRARLPAAPSDDNSFAVSHISSIVTEVDNDKQHQQLQN